MKPHKCHYIIQYLIESRHVGHIEDRMKTKTWKAITNSGKKADLESGLEQKRFKADPHQRPETLVIGWRPRAVSMAILCDHYLSCEGLASENALTIEQGPSASDDILLLDSLERRSHSAMASPPALELLPISSPDQQLIHTFKFSLGRLCLLHRLLPPQSLVRERPRRLMTG